MCICVIYWYWVFRSLSIQLWRYLPKGSGCLVLVTGSGSCGSWKWWVMKLSCSFSTALVPVSTIMSPLSLTTFRWCSLSALVSSRLLRPAVVAVTQLAVDYLGWGRAPQTAVTILCYQIVNSWDWETVLTCFHRFPLECVCSSAYWTEVFMHCSQL